MARILSEEEYTKTVSHVLDEINSRKDIKSSEALSTNLQPQNVYTLDDVVHAISQVSPDDAEMAREIVDDLETRRRPKALLTSIQDKVALYNGVDKARKKLAKDSVRLNDNCYELDLELLARQGIINPDEAKKYMQEIDILGMTLRNKASYFAIINGAESKAFKTGVYTFLGIGVPALAYAIMFAESGSGVGWGTAGIVGGLISSVISGGISNYKKEKQNKLNAEKKIEDFKGHFVSRLMNIEGITDRFLEQITKDNINAESYDKEEETIASISRLQQYLMSVKKTIKKIRIDYAKLKEAESGLPVENKMPLLEPSKPIKGRDE